MDMHFFRVTNDENAYVYLERTLNDALAKFNNVIWFVSGGSNIQISVDTLNKLDKANLAKLHVLLIDERFGEPGHKDSNYKQLLDAGFSPEIVDFKPVLKEHLDYLSETTSAYDHMVRNAFSEADFVVGQFGIGPDGHTAGILPGSTAADDNENLVASYETPIYDRITLTPKAIKAMSVCYVYVMGENRKDVIEELERKNLPVNVQPAQIFKEVKEAYIINREIGEIK
jgi:6-phosphogluconolactonase/glucosamine-6-phosphate isomerase/deaminase